MAVADYADSVSLVLDYLIQVVYMMFVGCRSFSQTCGVLYHQIGMTGPHFEQTLNGIYDVTDVRFYS